MDKNKTPQIQEKVKKSKNMSLDVSNILVDDKKATMTVTLSWIDGSPPDNIELTGTLFAMMYQMQNVFLSDGEKDLNIIEKKFYDTLKSMIKYILDERKERQGIIDASLNIVTKPGKRIRTQYSIDKARATRAENKLKKKFNNEKIDKKN